MITTRLLEQARLRDIGKCGNGNMLGQRLAMLDREDRLLAELAMSGAAHRQIGELLRVGPGTISRRLQRIGARLHDPIVERLLDPGCPLGPDYRQVGVEHFLAGHPLAEIAAAHQRTYASVRQTIDYIRTWHQASRGLARDSRKSR